MAEALLRSKLLNDYAGLAAFTEVTSAGTSALEDSPATDSAIQAMDLWGIDLEPHRASMLDASHLKDADLVLAMSREHLVAIARIDPRASSKSTTIRYLASSADEISRRLGEGLVRNEHEARKRIKAVLALLREINPESEFLADMQLRGSDIIDPIGSSLQVYLKVAEELDSSLDAIIRVLFGPSEVSP
jgi:protein-tyrosine phosphatase